MHTKLSKINEAVEHGALVCDKVCDVENAGPVYKIRDPNTEKVFYVFSDEAQLFTGSYPTVQAAVEASQAYAKSLIKIKSPSTITVEEAKELRNDIVNARNTLNRAIRVARDAGVFTDLEIRQITLETIGNITSCYYTVDAFCTVDPSKLK